MELRGLSPATALLVVELQLADIADLMLHTTEQDEYAALDSMRLEYEAKLLLLQDQVMAMNLLRADHHAQIAFGQLSREERQAEQDHRIALDMQAGIERQSSCSAPATQPPLDDVSFGSNLDASFGAFDSSEEQTYFEATLKQSRTTISTNLGQCYEYDGDTTTTRAESSTRRTSKGKQRAGHEHSTHIRCSACMEQKPRFDVLELNCQRDEDAAPHAYCRGCLVDLFQASLIDTTLFPPRCCGNLIPISACRAMVPPAVIRAYEEKEIELRLPNPVYCSNRYCGKFIKPQHIIADVATCAVCEAITCCVCKNPNHRGVCPKDPAVVALIDIAGKMRWQRCPKCRTLVELQMGCYHMTCPCGSQFCYLCAKPWKTCKCPQWDEGHLLSGNQTTAAPVNQIAMPEEEELVEADPRIDITNDLQMRVATVAGGFNIGGGDGDGLDVAACEHRWLRAFGRNGELEICGICHSYLKFVNSCRRCKTKVCNRCLNNRL